MHSFTLLPTFVTILIIPVLHFSINNQLREQNWIFIFFCAEVLVSQHLTCRRWQSERTQVGKANKFSWSRPANQTGVSFIEYFIHLAVVDFNSNLKVNSHMSFFTASLLYLMVIYANDWLCCKQSCSLLQHISCHLSTYSNCEMEQ